MASRVWAKDSVNILAFRLTNRVGGAQVTDATVTATVTLNGVAVFSARSMTYSSSETLGDGDTTTGAYTCEASAAECATAGTYTATITATKSAKTKVSTITILCKTDEG
jgi:hypothetical protein